MPYIEQDKRSELEPTIRMLVDTILHVAKSEEDLPGILNYVCTEVILRTMKRKCDRIRYYVLAWVEGILSHMSKEIYRREAVPYEEKKKDENNDIHSFFLD